MIPPLVVKVGAGLYRCETCGEEFGAGWRHYHASFKGSARRTVFTHPAGCTCGVCREIPCELRERGGSGSISFEDGSDG